MRTSGAESAEISALRRLPRPQGAEFYDIDKRHSADVRRLPPGNHRRKWLDAGRAGRSHGIQEQNQRFPHPARGEQREEPRALPRTAPPVQTKPKTFIVASSLILSLILIFAKLYNTTNASNPADTISITTT